MEGYIYIYTFKNLLAYNLSGAENNFSLMTSDYLVLIYYIVSFQSNTFVSVKYLGL